MRMCRIAEDRCKQGGSFKAQGLQIILAGSLTAAQQGAAASGPALQGKG
jgi:hypothetical protein